MPKLPILSGKEVIRLLEKAGFTKLDQSGSHVIMLKVVDEIKLKTVVPMHSELKIGTLLSILKQAKLSREELFKLIYA